MSEDFQNTGYILHPAKGKIPFFCNFATVEDLEAAISKLNSLTPKVVDELPPVGESGILYFVPSTDASSEDQSKEYIWLEQENRFELVGSTGVDLSDVVTISSDQVISGTKEFSSSLLVGGGITSQSGVTINQSLIVLGIGSFSGGTLNISDSSGDLDKTIEIKSDTGGTAISVPPVIGSLYDDDRAVYSRIDNDQRYIKFVELTEAEYKELETKSVSTIYYLSDIAMWTIGDKEIITSDITA